MAVFALDACSRSKELPVTRIAILPCENLTGDASLDWVASSAASILAAELTGVPKVLPIRSQTVSDGYLARAVRFVHASFTGQPGHLRYEIEIEDAASHKITDAFGDNGDVLAAMDRAAKVVNSAAHAFSTSNPAAVDAWGHGDYEKAVALDPSFGPAWLAWAETAAAKGDVAKAIEIAGKGRGAAQTDVDRERIGLLYSQLTKDPTATKTLGSLARAVKTDPSIYALYGEAESKARHFADAVSALQTAVELDPEDVNLLNSLGYAQAFAGSMEAAVKTFEEYGRPLPQKANSLDSLGEAYFMRGKFAEAEKAFLGAQQTNPALLAGADLLKAAYARWLAGDHGAADKLFANYLEFRRSQKDSQLEWREASWLYSTGRKDAAIAKLEAVSNKQLALQQSALWRGDLKLTLDINALKLRYDNTTPASDTQIRVLYASALVEAGQQDEARRLLELWPMPWAPGDAVLESWVLPEFLKLRAAAGMK